MRIKLKRGWFAWDGGFYKAKVWHSVPDEWKKKGLPSDAEVEEDEVEAKPMTASEKKKVEEQKKLDI